MKDSTYRELYRLMQQKCGGVAEGGATALAVIATSTSVRTMLERIGLLRGDSTVTSIVEKLSRAAEVPEEAVAATLLRYVSVCGVEPHCDQCPPELECRYRSPHATIKSLPEDERPRERLLRSGEEVLSDSELLAIIIRDGTPQASAIELGRRLIARYKTFRAMSAASVAELCSVPGIGPAKAAQIKAALAIARRFAGEKLLPGKKIGGSRDVFEHFHETLRDEKKETFWAVLLDQKHKVIREDRISVGSLAESLVHPREVFRNAIRESAAAIIFVHNHPSGDPSPSPQDIEVTKKLVQTGLIVGINVLDHVIIGGGEYVSLKSRGLM